jgi:hypothetical protein
MSDPHTNSGRWFAVSADMWDHPIVGAKRPVTPADPKQGSASCYEAWQWLIRSACFKTHSVMNRGRKMTLQRGDLLGSYSFLAAEWNWTPKTVRVFIEKLIRDQMLMDVTLDIQRHFVHKQGQLKGNSKGNKKDNSKAVKMPSKRSLIKVLNVSNYFEYQHDPRAQLHYESLPEGQRGGQAKKQTGATEGQLKGNTVQGIHNKKDDTRASDDVNPNVDPVTSWDQAFDVYDHGVTIDANGRLTLVNGERSFWLKKFDGDSERLDLALIQAAGYVQPNSSRPLQAQVAAQLSKICAEKVDRDQRYNRAARANGKQPPADTKSKAEKYRKIAEENAR